MPPTEAALPHVLYDRIAMKAAVYPDGWQRRGRVHIPQMLHRLAAFGAKPDRNLVIEGPEQHPPAYDAQARAALATSGTLSIHTEQH